jgi:hypothetical protein
VFNVVDVSAGREIGGLVERLRSRNSVTAVNEVVLVLADERQLEHGRLKVVHHLLLVVCGIQVGMRRGKRYVECDLLT